MEHFYSPRHLPPLCRHVEARAAEMASKLRVAAAAAAAAVDNGSTSYEQQGDAADLGRMVREYLVLQLLARRTSLKPQQRSSSVATSLRLPSLNEKCLNENAQVAVAEKTVAVAAQHSAESSTYSPPVPSVVLEQRGRCGSFSSVSTCSWDDELPSPALDPVQEMSIELDRAIGCGRLDVIQKLLNDVRNKPQLAATEEVARPLLALQAYARRLREVCRDSLCSSNNVFTRV